jgi:ABC-type maltose transport system permease subunit
MRFITPLFDFSFSQFITNKVARILYALALMSLMLVSVIGYGRFVLDADGFFGTTGALIIGLPLAALFFLVTTAIVRVSYEMIIVLFRIAENVQNIARSVQEARQAGEPAHM